MLANGHLVIGSRASAIAGVAPDTGHVDWVDRRLGRRRQHRPLRRRARPGLRRRRRRQPLRRRTRHRQDPLDLPRQGGDRAPRPELGPDLVYVASASDHLVALDPATGKWRWQYERETPEGFTIHGYAGPRLHGNELLAGFADGYLVSLSAGAGEVLWARSLATASEQFVDVDTTPTLVGDLAYAASYSGGLYAVDAKDGTIKWRLGVEGVGDVSVADGHLFFAAPTPGRARRRPRRPRPVAPGSDRGRRSDAARWSSAAT